MQKYKLQDLVLVIQMHFQFDQKLTFLKFSTLAAEGPVHTPSSLKSWHVQALYKTQCTLTLLSIATGLTPQHLKP